MKRNILRLSAVLAVVGVASFVGWKLHYKNSAEANVAQNELPSSNSKPKESIKLKSSSDGPKVLRSTEWVGICLIIIIS